MFCRIELIVQRLGSGECLMLASFGLVARENLGKKTPRTSRGVRGAALQLGV